MIKLGRGIETLRSKKAVGKSTPVSMVTQVEQLMESCSE